jgi:hypothetical protein
MRINILSGLPLRVETPGKDLGKPELELEGRRGKASTSSNGLEPFRAGLLSRQERSSAPGRTPAEKLSPGIKGLHFNFPRKNHHKVHP